MSAVKLRQVAPDSLLESPFNRRRRWGALDELAASITENGVLEPLMARPVGDALELVFGHRRRRAAILAKTDEVPVLVRQLDDAQVLEAQLAENGDREDVHPLDEAEGYRDLVEKHGRSVEDLAAKTGRSRAYIYGRLKLCTLTGKARDLFLEDKITPALALLVARLPEHQQDEAIDRIEESVEQEWRPNREEEADLLALSIKEARAIIAEDFLLRLADAPFSRTDAGLVPRAGACSTCPKRTGVQPELFDDVESPDTCTDPKCFREKRDAEWTRRAEIARAAGRTVLEGDEAKKVIQYGRVMWSAPYVSLNDKTDEGEKTWKQKLGGEKVVTHLVVLARDDDGNIHELVPKSEVREQLKEAGEKLPYGLEESGRGSSSGKSGPTPAEVRSKLRRAAYPIALEKIATAAAKRAPDLAITSFLFRRALADSHSDTKIELLRRRGWERQKGKAGLELPEATVQRATAAFDAAQLFGVLVELLATRFIYGSWDEKVPEAIADAAKVFRVDLDKIVDEVKAEQRAAKKAKTAKASPAKAAKKPAGKAKKK